MYQSSSSSTLVESDPDRDAPLLTEPQRRHLEVARVPHEVPTP